MSLFEDIGSHEGFEDKIYRDHVGAPTIGVGYNLRNEDVLKAVLEQFGYSESTLSKSNFDTLLPLPQTNSGLIKGAFVRLNLRHSLSLIAELRY